MENPKTILRYLINMQDVYKKNKEYSPDRTLNILTAIGDMVIDMQKILKLTEDVHQIVAELFIRGRQLSTSIFFGNLILPMTQSYFQVPEAVILNCSFLSWKLKTNKNFKISHLIIHQIIYQRRFTEI